MNEFLLTLRYPNDFSELISETLINPTLAAALLAVVVLMINILAWEGCKRVRIVDLSGSM